MFLDFLCLSKSRIILIILFLETYLVNSFCQHNLKLINDGPHTPNRIYVHIGSGRNFSRYRN